MRSVATRLFAPCLCLLMIGSSACAISLTGFYKLDDTSLSTATATVGADGSYGAGFAAGDLGQAFSPGDPAGFSVNFPTSGQQVISIPNGGGAGGAGGDNFSVTMWIQLENTAGDKTLAANGSFSGGSNLLWWRDETTSGGSGGGSNTMAALVDGDPRANANTGSLNDTDWHLVALTYDGVERLYIDGANVTDGLPGSDGALSAATIMLGNASGLPGDKQFEGLMDEVAFWDQALTDEEMDALHFLSEAEGDFVTDAEGAAALFDLFEDGMTGDSLIIGNLQFSVVGDVTEFGGTAGQSVESNGRLLLGLDPNGAGLLGQQVPEPASVAIWSLLGLAAAGFAYRRWRNRK